MTLEDLPGSAPATGWTGLVVDWFEENGRSFPWRSIQNAYYVLVAEIMLQRTRADQVEPIFQEFVAAGADPSYVLEKGEDYCRGLFGQLGLHWRAPLFLDLNRVLYDEHSGEVPDSMDELLQLPGVGQYAATAVMVFAFGHSMTVVDSNVLRVFRRYFGWDLPDHARRSRKVLALANSMCPNEPGLARKFNWGLLDLGALICTKTNAKHHECPVKASCWFFQREVKGTDV